MDNTTIKIIIILLAAILTYIVGNVLYYSIHGKDDIKNKIVILKGTIALEIVFIIAMIILILP